VGASPDPTEEVLRAEEDAYRFVGYIVQSHGERVAISDPLAQSHNTVGDEISFLAIRTNVTGNRVISFMASPAGLGGPTQAKQPTAALTSVENGVIDEVLSTKVDGYNYTAYIVESLGARVVVPDRAGASPHRAGDQIFFESRRISNPRTPDHGILDFAPKMDAARSISEYTDLRFQSDDRLLTNLSVLPRMTYGAFCIGGGFHLPVSAAASGQYRRMKTTNGPLGAGSQLASLSALGDSA
jgi:hypothetical protein